MFKILSKWVIAGLMLASSAVWAAAEPVAPTPDADTATITPQSAEHYGQALCSQPGFKCINIKSSDTWFKMFPDARQRNLVMRLNRTNVPLRFRPWIIVPADLEHADYMNLSPLPEYIKPTGHKLLLVDLGKFAFGAYDDNGNLVRWGPASGGETWCDDDNKSSCQTRLGQFKLYRIQGANCQSSEFPRDTAGGAPMPYCMHYYRGYAIHGSTLSGFLNKSKGCVRLFDSDAKWISQEFAKVGTTVVVRR